MSLTVLNVAYPLAPAAPDAVGGAEQILVHIDRALAAAGHRSIVIAHEASVVAGELIPVRGYSGQLTPEVCKCAQRVTREAIESVLRSERVDVIHFHGIDFYAYLCQTDVPMVATLHLPPDWYPPEVFEEHRNLWLHCVSASQRKMCPPGTTLLADIPNGVLIPDVRPRTRQHYAASLGRVCEEKGFHVAADACGRAGVGYLLAGAVYAYEAHQTYFDRELKPRLDGVSRRFIGPVTGEKKAELLASAKCVLVPSLVAETSSLVTMEALAAGTPVVAFRSGALPDLIEHGKTGYIVDTPAEMAEAIAGVDSISPEACRESAVDRFSCERMTSAYLDLYANVAGTAATAPFVRTGTEYPVERRNLKQCEAMWRSVYSASSATPFQSPDWLEPWWECFGQGDLILLTAGEAGVLPLYLHDGALRFLGAGITDYLDLIAKTGAERAVTGSLARYLVDMPEWDRCELCEVPARSPLLLMQLPPRVAFDIHPGSTCPVVDLRTWRQPAKLAKSLRYSFRRLARAGETSFTTLPASQAVHFVDTLIDLHEKRWEKKNSGGLLRDTQVQRFHRLAIPSLARAGLARMHVLRHKGIAIAALYCLTKGGRTYYYLGGFDPEFDVFSPGSLLVNFAIQDAIARGDVEFDFLRGGEPYKYSWGAKDRLNRQIVIRSKPTAASLESATANP